MSGGDLDVETTASVPLPDEKRRAAALAVAGRAVALGGDPACRCKHAHKALCRSCGCPRWRPPFALIEQTLPLLQALGLAPYEQASGTDPVTRKPRRETP